MSNPANIYYTATSGIWQTVWLETVPETFIQNIKLTPDIDKNQLNLSVSLNDPNTKMEIEATAYEKGKKIANWHNKHISIPNPHLWSPSDPFLYDLVVRIKQDGKVIDEVKSYFGMRKIAIHKGKDGFDRIFLNNKYTYNLGTLDQGFWPDGLYTAPTDNALKFDIQAIKTMGFNTIRKHIKVEPARWYYWADKLGMLVWQDLVNPNQGLPEGSKPEFERESAEELAQLYNYPSIVTWVLFNEKWGQYDQARLTKWLKEADPSRIVNGHSGEYLYVDKKLRSPSPNAYVNADLTDVHSYPDPMLSEKQEGKAQVCGEFGGIGVAVPGHEWNDLKGWGYVEVKASNLIGGYQNMINQLKKLEKEGLSASIYTQPFDVEGEENGLMTYDRDVIKMPLMKIRAMNGQIIPLHGSGFSIPKNFNIGKTLDINDNDDRYPEFLHKFAKGERDSAFLRRLTLVATRKKDSTNLKNIYPVYFGKLREPLSDENMAFSRATVTSTKDEGFKLLINIAKQKKGKASPTINQFIDQIITFEYYNRLINSKSSPNYDSIENEVHDNLGEQGEHAVWTALAAFAHDKKDLAYFVLYKDKLQSKYYKNVGAGLKGEGSTFFLNKDAWFVFKNSANKHELESALVWAQLSVDVEREDASLDPRYRAGTIDTYANILYKLGKKEEALKYESEALKLSGGDKDFVETIEKMKSDLPTW